MDNDDGTHIFCSNCGKVLSKYYKYCPECGVRIVYDTNIDDFRPLFHTSAEIRLNWSTVILGIFGAFSILVAIPELFFSESVADMIKFFIGPDTWDQLIKSWGITRLDFVLSLQNIGACHLITGIFSLLSMYLCLHRTYFVWAFSLALASSFTILIGLLFIPRLVNILWIFVSVVQFLIGVTISAIVYSSRSQFLDYE